MDDVREGLTAIDRALVEALDVHPSPEFMARVRQRIAGQPVPRPLWSAWRIVVPVAAAAVLIVISAVVVSRRAPSPPRLATRSLGIGQIAPSAVAPSRPLVAAPVTPMSAGRFASVPARASREPEVLVPREEIEMYRRLIAAAQRAPHAVVVEMPKDIVAPGSFPEIAIDPIKIELILPPAGREGDRQ